MFAPVFKAASRRHPEIVFGKVDTMAEPGLAQAARITAIPTVMAYREGVLVYSQPSSMLTWTVA
jgi:thioredoxin 1